MKSHASIGKNHVVTNLDGLLEILVIDSNVPDYQILIDGVKPGTEVILIDGGDGVQQLAAALEGRSGIDALHIVSHGSEGALYLGDVVLNTQTLENYGEELDQIGEVLSEAGDILLYGCDIAAGEVGIDFIATLAQRTQADVAASDDPTGNRLSGGDWSLEEHGGDVETGLVFSEQAMLKYASTLAAFTETFVVDPMAGASASTFSTPLGSVPFDFTFTGEGDGGDFSHEVDSGESGSASICAISSDFNVGTDERITIVRSGGADFIFDSIYVNNSLGNTVTVAGYNGGDPIGSPQTVAGGNSTTLNFGSIVVDEVRITSQDMNMNFDMFVGNTTVNNAPAFMSTTSFAIDETASNTSNVLHDVNANDGDGGGSDTDISYEIIGGTGSSLFSIDNDDGEVRLTGYGASALDYESATSYTLQVRADDGEGTNSSTDQTITINVNDIAPALTGGQSFGVNESAINMDSVGTVAYTGDTDSVTFSIESGNTGSAFAIDVGSGEIIVNDTSQLDASSSPSYTLTVKGFDGTTQSIADVTVNVMDDVKPAVTGVTVSGTPAANAASVDFVVTFSESVNAVTADDFTVTTASGTAAGTVTSVSDSSGSSIIVTVGSITGDGTLRLDVNAGTDIKDDAGNGNGINGSVAAYIAGATHTVDRVAPVVTDGHISITGASGAGGAFIVGDTVTASWDNTAGGDNNTDTIAGVTVDFSPFGGGSAVAASNGAGFWSASYTLTEEGGGSIDGTNANITITVTDDGGNPTIMADTSNAIVDNDSPGVPTATLAVAENSANSTVVGTVSGGGTDEVTYSLTNNVGGRFAIDAGGNVTVADGTLLDYETDASHNITVQATDNAGNTTDAVLSVTVNDINEAPTCTVTASDPTHRPGGGASTLYSAATISAIESGQDIAQMTLTVTHVTDGDDEILQIDGTRVALTHSNSGSTATNGFGYSVALVDTTATVTLTRSDSPANWQTLVNGVQYENTSSTPTISDDRVATLTSISDTGSNSGSNDNFTNLSVASTIHIGMPTIDSSAYDWDTGQLVITGTNFVSQAGATNDLISSMLTITGEGGSYTLTDSANVEISSATAATVTLSATDKLYIDGLLNRNGTSSATATYNLAAADGWMPQAPADESDLVGNAITVSNVALPTISSAIYDSDSGVVVVTGSNFSHREGANNDIDISTITFTGGTAGATYGITNASDVEITSSTSFTFTLTGSDKTNVDALLDQIGTSSSGGTDYNIAVSDNWLTGADNAADISDVSGNGTTVLLIPKITSSTYDASTGELVVTGSNIQENGSGSDIDALKFTFTGEGGDTYSLTNTADVERTSVSGFTLTLSDTDKTAVNLLLNNAGTISADTTVYNLSAADDWNTNVTAGDSSDRAGNTITVANTAPTLTNLHGDSVAFVVGGSSKALDVFGNATLTDLSSANLDGGNVTVSIIANGQEAEDVLSIGSIGSISTSGSNVNHSGTTIASFAGGNGGADLVISLNSDATVARVQDMIRVLQYTDTDASTTNTLARTIRVVVNDGDGGRDTSTNQDITVNLVNVPVIDLDGDDSSGATNGGYSASFTEGDSAVSVVDTDASLADNDSTNFNQLVIQLTNAQTGDVIKVGSRSSGDIVNGVTITEDSTSQITLSGSASKANYLALIKELTFNNNSLGPDTTERTITFIGRDTDGNTGLASTAMISVTAVNDTPEIVHNAQQFYGPKVITNTADGVLRVTAADVDSDGDLDILSASYWDDTVGWFQNDGEGNFSDLKVISSAVNGASFATAADVDGDGDLDVLSAAIEGDVIAWHENDGAGNFSALQEISSAVDAPWAVASADIDGDGDLDVISSAFLGDTIVWHQNDGVASFSAPQVISDTAGGVKMITTADVDGDGDLDVISALSSDGVIAWYQNDGTGSFSAPQIISDTASLAAFVATADVDGDGDLDLLTASQGDSTVGWYQNDGAGNFSALREISSAVGDFMSVTAADIDGDGDLDVLSSAYDGTVGWYQNDGVGNFSDQQSVDTVGLAAFSVIAVDVDGDGDQDLLSTSYSDDTITLSENGLKSREDDSVVFSAANNNRLTVADIDGDQLTLLLNAADGTISVVTGGSALIENNGNDAVTVTGSVAEVNAALATVMFTPDSNFSGNTSLNLRLQDDSGAGNSTTTKTINISVAPINDAPRITSNGGGGTASIDVAEKSTAVTTISITDPDDGDTVSYSLSGGADQAKFAINADSGLLTFIVAPDFENPTDSDNNNSYEVEITAADSVGATDSQTVTVNVTDVSEGGGGTPPADSDGDGISDSEEGSGDTDGDGIPDRSDDDSDNDGIPDAEEGSTDSDADGIPDSQDTDSDNDGQDDAAEAGQDTDEDGTPDNLDSDDDNDGIDSSVEAQVPTLGEEGLTGDGNGDGIADTRQAEVSSVSFKETAHISAEPEALQVFVTLIADSDQGQEDTADDNNAILQNVQQQDAPDGLPEGFEAPLGLISFSADVENSGEVETFSLYVDDSLLVNGYFKQDSAGNWVNLASAEYGGQVVTVGGTTRLDFVLTDGGEFDDDGIANGIIVDPGVVGYMIVDSDINDDKIADGSQPEVIRIHNHDGDHLVALAVSPVDNYTILDSLISFGLAELPSTPSQMEAPFGLFSFSAQITDATEVSHFNLYVSDATAVNGFWAQNAAGLFVKLATDSEEMSDGNTRLDFEIEDGSLFDHNPIEGEITVIGAPASQPLTILGVTPDMATDGFWF